MNRISPKQGGDIFTSPKQGRGDIFTACFSRVVEIPFSQITILKGVFVSTFKKSDYKTKIFYITEKVKTDFF